MKKIVLWIPNFSEGRNKEVIDKISAEALKCKGCALLDVNSGVSTNRTVYTFAGAPDDLLQAALNACKVAYTLVDMTKHKGEHPRLGSLDVSPFIPLKNVSFEECIELSKTFATKLASTLNVPVYLYGMSSKLDYRKTVSQIRAAEYEGLEAKLADPQWKPDYGPNVMDATWGASIVGCRDFLIAFNVNILSTKEQAHRIALNIRESGRGPNQPGRLKNVQAIGWMLEEDIMAQVSTNLVDFRSTPIYEVIEEVQKDAKEMGLPIVGSEIIGLVPLEALMMCAQHYIESENLMILDESNKIKLVINRLGLNTVKPFDKNNQIIEYRLGDQINAKGYIDTSLKEFVMQVGSRSPLPGGGSVAALVGSLGCALSCMVGLLSYGNKKFEDNDEKLKKILPRLHDEYHSLLHYIDEDARAFKLVMETNKKRFKNIAEKDFEKREALKYAAQVPINLAKKLDQMWPLIKELTTNYNRQTLSDFQVAIRLINTALWGCYYNVSINLSDIKEDSVQEKIKQIHELCVNGDLHMKELLELLESS